MTVEDRIAFDKQAGGYVLHKSNKLQIQSRKNDDEDILKHVINLQHQLKAIRDHVFDYDMDDVFTIVLPVNQPTECTRHRAANVQPLR